ncbi:hypothetical protein E4U55_007159 [Claviceps digitariae]|nr:hypothetical protein E4U55_007159 [Claviceps digitariae]
MSSTDSQSCWTASSQSSQTSSLASVDPLHDPLAPSLEQLVGQDDDVFIPASSDISQTFHDGLETWTFFLNKAQSFPPGHWPPGTLDPYMTLLNVPRLPDKIPYPAVLRGRPRWRLHMSESMPEATEPWDPSLVDGAGISLYLDADDPILCNVCSEAATPLLATIPGLTDSHAVLTMCWAYILSVRLIEMQQRQVVYTKHRLWPSSESSDCAAGPSVCVDGASPALVRWLSAILCPNVLGWSPKDGTPLPPWSACLSENTRLITRSGQAPFDDHMTAPTSSEAAHLLLELCQLYALNSDVSTREGQEETTATLPPCRAAFLAALVLPFYYCTKLSPQFPPPNMYPVQNQQRSSYTSRARVLKYLHHLPYFMTLSLYTPSIGCVMWSAFWQPDIDCNLVSPWLASIVQVLDPILASENNMEMFVKVVAVRRPRVAIWWLAVFLLGDVSTLGWFRRYAESLFEKRAFPTFSKPETVVSAWTGVEMSFLDRQPTKQYMSPDDLVTREDWLRCRLLFKLQEACFASLAWRPFGTVTKCDVEPELWPYLESEHRREYHSFAWHSGNQQLGMSFGFQQETAQPIEVAQDDLKRRRSATSCHAKCQHDIRLEPSKSMTLKMIYTLERNSVGDDHWTNCALPAASMLHPWLKDYEGLDRRRLARLVSAARGGTD